MTIQQCQMCGTYNRPFKSAASSEDADVILTRYDCGGCGSEGILVRHRETGETDKVGAYFWQPQQEQPMTDETNDTQTTETVHSGVSITAKLKRGSETRDQDTLTLKGKGADAEAATEEFEKTLQAAEENGWADRLRKIQPDEDGEDDE